LASKAQGARRYPGGDHGKAGEACRGQGRCPTTSSRRAPGVHTLTYGPGVAIGSRPTGRPLPLRGISGQLGSTRRHICSGRTGGRCPVCPTTLALVGDWQRGGAGPRVTAATYRPTSSSFTTPTFLVAPVIKILATVSGVRVAICR
jgi:hypothetical protein